MNAIRAALFVLPLATALCAQTTTFDAGNGGWLSATLPYLVPGAPPVEVGVPLTPVFAATGGNPGGYVHIVDPDGHTTGNVQYWKAPAAFLGNKADHLDGALRFDLIEFTGFAPFAQEDVLLTGNGMTLAYTGLAAPPASWTRCRVPLGVGSWRVGDHTGPLATAAELTGVLGALTSLYIRGEFQFDNDDMGIDNIAFEGPGVAQAYGSGCQGSNHQVPLLDASALPAIGSTFSLRVSQALPSGLVLLAVGFSNTGYQAQALPFSLTAFGAPGCSVLAAPESTTTVPTNAGGQGAMAMNVPDSLALLSLHLFAQGFALDGGANALGLAVSNGLALVVGL